jgi:hypothetical protein
LFGQFGLAAEIVRLKDGLQIPDGVAGDSRDLGTVQPASAKRVTAVPRKS